LLINPPFNNSNKDNIIMNINGVYEGEYGVTFFDHDGDNFKACAISIFDECPDIVGTDIDATNDNGEDISQKLYDIIAAFDKHGLARFDTAVF
tara:strand:+ start:293 stop:571 length:279 start_codon:yes stop_codon:yes gene_type:complete